jgi:hypothetical protein
VATQPRTAKLSSATQVLWDSGEPFDGFVAIYIALPGDHTLAALDNSYANLIPLRTVIPIVEGVYNQNCSLYFNADIEPPNTQYVAYWYDATKKRIAPSGDGTLFTVTADPHVLTPPTLTVPPTATTVPAPQEVPVVTASVPVFSRTFSSITVTASPFTYRNTQPVEEVIFISDGTITLLEISPNNVTWTAIGTSTSSITLLSGAYLRVTYTDAPTMNKMS